MAAALPNAPSLTLRAAIVAALALWAATLALMLFTAERLYSIPMLLVTLFPVVLYTTGNPRLFFFMGMIFTATLGLSINFARHIHVGGAPSYAIDLMDFFMVPLLAYQVRDFIRGARHPRFFPGLSSWWLGLAALGVISVVIGPFRNWGAMEVLRMLKLWLLMFVVVNECVHERHFHHAVVAMAAAVLMQVAVGYTQYALKRELGLQALGEPAPEAVMGANLGVYGSFGSVFRIGALMGHPNLLSTYLAMEMPLFVALIFTDYTLRWKVFYAAVTLAASGALVLTLSRSGWFSFATALALLLALMILLPRLRFRHVRLKIGVIVGLFLAGLTAAPLIYSRLTQSQSGALDFREEWVKVAFRMVLDNPILGHGINSFSYVVGPYAPYSVPKMYEMFGEHYPVVHNIYMLVWTEQGTLGLLLFLGFHVHLAWIAIGNMRKAVSEKVYMVSLGAFCGVVAVLVDGLASFYVKVPASARTFFILAALIVAARYWNNAQIGAARRQQAAMTTRNEGAIPCRS